jgi:hypothetical protein
VAGGEVDANQCRYNKHQRKNASQQFFVHWFLVFHHSYSFSIADNGQEKRPSALAKGRSFTCWGVPKTAALSIAREEA